MNQRLIYVMGPSGAGKDSVLGWLRKHLPAGMPVHWAQRTITRPVSGQGETHEAIDIASFLELKNQSQFALTWQANGLHYGVRHTELKALQQGDWVFVNGSRGHLHHVQQSHPGLQMVHITADSATLMQRLTARQRETPDQIRQRIERANAFAVPQAVIQILNNGTLDQAGHELLLALKNLKDWPAT
jgi:ribose 1,5-bisphosphokinase